MWLQNPIIIGHEFCGDIIAVGKNGSISFSPASAMSFRLTCNCRIAWTALATLPVVGGEATHVIIPDEVMEQGLLC